MKTFLYTAIALAAFAGNSVLCRLALGNHVIDAAGFTAIRLFAGALVLIAILKLTGKTKFPISRGSWKASFMLFLYAAAFSYAYISLDTGTGALVLFSAVQATMIIAGMVAGNRLCLLEWAGFFTAFAGFVYLSAPSLSTPSIAGFILMTIAGAAWGFYTLAGKNSTDPLADTAYNFLRALLFVSILAIVAFHNISLSFRGILLAVLSGSIASGAGYAVWYAALRGLSSTQAAVVQLFVPVLAAAGGVVFTNENFSLRMALSSLMILGGILTAVLAPLPRIFQEKFSKNNKKNP